MIQRSGLGRAAAYFPSSHVLEVFLADTRLELLTGDQEVWVRAGQAWGMFAKRQKTVMVCAKCGRSQQVPCMQCQAPLRSRQHIVADFLIGAHTELRADQLLTRDRGYYSTYFPNLSLVLS
ncbi:MAG: hypothetical protein NPIRA01_40170 [Nitrospirales bacterium]|nr:MAG: hypothetical protein NPIRA01_40170 [Nitrospirales bacterium]